MTRPVQRPVELPSGIRCWICWRRIATVPLSVKQKHAGCRNAQPETAVAGLSRVVQHNLQTVLGYDLLAVSECCESRLPA